MFKNTWVWACFEIAPFSVLRLTQGARTSHSKNIMRECRGGHISCWRLLNRMEITIKYCPRCWYCCPGDVNSLGYHGAHLNENINKILTLCGPRGPTLANPTRLDPLKVTINILAKITRRAQTTRRLCANDARAMREGGFWRELTFPKFQGCWHGAQDACRSPIAWKLPMREHVTKISSGLHMGPQNWWSVRISK